MRMPRALFAFVSAALALAAPATAQEALVDLDTALRCSAGFSLIAAEQQRGTGMARTDFPPLAQRGREFFVQTAARLMDERKLTREQVQSRLLAEVAQQQNEAASGRDGRTALMNTCLPLLDATIPARLPLPG